MDGAPEKDDKGGGGRPGGLGGVPKVGAHRVGSVATVGSNAWMYASPEELCHYSPLMAMRAYLGVPWQPYMPNLAATFVQDGPTTLNPISWEDPTSVGQGGGKPDQFLVCDRMVFEIDAPNAGDGAFLKGLNDWFYARNSGIRAIFDMLGRPKYEVAPFFTPIASICAMINEGWPHGWVIQYGQAARMQFKAFQEIPSFPTTIVVTFRCWTPAGSRFRQLSEYDAAEFLKTKGIDCGDTNWADY